MVENQDKLVVKTRRISIPFMMLFIIVYSSYAQVNDSIALVISPLEKLKEDMHKINTTENKLLISDFEKVSLAFSKNNVNLRIYPESCYSVFNKQLFSPNIINVIGFNHIQKFREDNTAELIGRLPGISLLRTGGQSRQLVFRGLNPENNLITINGVPIPANENYRTSLEGGEEFGSGRGVDMRIIPSSSLDNITAYKTYSPDMDAAFLGGTIDLGIRKAKKNLETQHFGLSYLPSISLQSQGGYTDITNEYNNYKFDLSLEKRFLDERFGIFVEGGIQHQNLTWDGLNANYVQIDQIYSPDQLAMKSLNLYFYPSEEKRLNGTVTVDYNIPDGNLSFTNIFSQVNSNTKYYQQNYNLQRGGNSIYYYGNNSTNELSFITNIFNYNQKTSFVDINATFSHSYSKNINPNTWTIGFVQYQEGLNTIDDELPPIKIAEMVHEKTDMENLDLRTISTNNSATAQRDFRGSLDFSKDLHLTDFLSLEVKIGGMYSYSDRNHDYDRGNGYIWFGELGDRIVDSFPWLKTKYGIGNDDTDHIFITPFLDNDINIGTYLNSEYTFDNRLNLDYMQRIKEIVVDYGYYMVNNPTPADPPSYWMPDMVGSQISDYSGDEKRSAGYIMGTFHFGQSVSIMAGVRHQNLTTSYRANRFYNASATNPYPYELPHIDTTITKSHGYWLPAVYLKINPVSWLGIQGSYSNTLTYPNYRAIIPVIDVYTSLNYSTTTHHIVWNNTDLKPTRSENIDLQLSVYEGNLGLFTIGGFLKHINDYVIWRSGDIKDLTVYEGLQDIEQYLPPDHILSKVTKYSLSTYFNSPHQVSVQGIECDWQTRFWYLPGVLKGLALNVNYTHTFSKAIYQHTLVRNSGFPLFQTEYIDTAYMDRLINQPDDIVNISLGYDYKDFSILISMNYQSGILNNTNFYDALKSDQAEYLCWNLAVKQKLSWYNLEIFMNLNNLTKENSTYIMRGNGYPLKEESYGLRIDLGFRLNVF